MDRRYLIGFILLVFSLPAAACLLWVLDWLIGLQ